MLGMHTMQANLRGELALEHALEADWLALLELQVCCIFTAHG